MSIQSIDLAIPISTIMSTHVICARIDDSLGEARTMMLREKIGGAPVVDHHGRLCGIISKTDLVRDAWLMEDEPSAPDLSADERARLGPGYHLEREAEVTVGQVMTPYAVSLPPETSVARAAAVMSSEGIHRVVVATAGGRIVGLVSLTDVARCAALRAGFVVDRAHRALDAAA